ncbi:Rhomboid family protein [Desulfocicer vacuolatum DSM 3385]|uniref:Rhomboid family protein n=1 Tax=Desulfocicer vacuolatum DSM 3385 TaxID=1121400 RepID=A0A1W2E7I7_9BACT|nr:rhomboid family intramembrane serine protease [Desulfocicer vacuolatum]SMD05724.1 Rhomboid family protein [Desulfocicer vacuolatum DSM 3385]
MKIKYNAPVILTYSILSISILAFSGNGLLAGYFSSPAHLSLFNPYFYFRLLSYIAAHGSWSHLMGNFMIILLVGPLLEEKYGSITLLEMIFITAIATALLNAVLFSTSLIGGSGIAFMLILLSSFSNIRSGEIPLTFILISILYIGSEVLSILKVDQISQFSHLAGGFIGAGYGFIRGGRTKQE